MTSTAWPLSPLPSSCCLSEPPPPGPPLPCLSPPPLQRIKSWLATRLSVVTQYAFSFLPGQENRSLHALSEEHVQRGKRLGREKGWASSSPATPATHAPRPWASPPFCHYPSPCTRSRPSLSLWQASGLRASALGRCLLGDPRVGMSSNKGPLCLPTCCPPEHIPFLSGS